MYNIHFPYIEDFKKEQETAEHVLNKKLSDSFDEMMKKINCLLPSIEEYSAAPTIGVLANVRLQLI